MMRKNRFSCRKHCLSRARDTGAFASPGQYTTGSAGNSGFSLLEMLAALMILSLVTTTLVSIQTQSWEEARLTKQTRIAWTLAQKQYGELQRYQNPDNIPSGDTFENHPDYAWETSVSQETLEADPPIEQVVNNEDVDRTYEQEEQRRQMIRVELTVTYPGVNQDERQIELVEYRIPPDEYMENQQSHLESHDSRFLAYRNDPGTIERGKDTE